MADKRIVQAPGGQLASPVGDEILLVDDNVGDGDSRYVRLDVVLAYIQNALLLDGINAPASMVGYSPQSADLLAHLTAISTRLEATLPARGAIGVKVVSAGHALINDDLGDRIVSDSASPQTITVQAQSAVNWQPGAGFDVWQRGTGQTTITGAAGVSINGVAGGSVAIPSQYQGVSLVRVAEDDWLCTVVAAL